jgi:MFS family permease
LSSLGNQLLIFVGFVLSIIFSAVSPTIASAYINKLIPSEERATLLSANSMAYSLCMIILFPVIGGIIDLLDFRIAYLTMGLSIMVVGGTFAVVVKKRYYRKSAD